LKKHKILAFLLLCWTAVQKKGGYEKFQKRLLKEVPKNKNAVAAVDNDKNTNFKMATP
jgi:hypothetical protein